MRKRVLGATLVLLCQCVLAATGPRIATAQGTAGTPTAPPTGGDTPEAHGPAAATDGASAPYSGADPAAVLAGMTPEQRVGQLFLAAFLGADFGPESDVARLIEEADLGGVVLQASSANIANTPGGGPAKVASDVAGLQSAALGPGGNGIPLFVAVDHEGDGEPLTHLRFGYTPVPSAMAIGGTWSPEMAGAVGEVVGRELAASGVNMLLGPVLDVLAEPRTSQRGDIGVRAFGGDPYWVGLMGRAYISGVHAGGGGRVLTVAKHFPGHGASDRLPDTEVATVSKSLAELRRVEIPPFEAVTGGPPGSDPAVTDALMTSHIRYRGFQGNLRDTTPPISLDPEALATVFSLDESPLSLWRRGGGLVVADSLGVRALRRYDDPSGQSFRHRDIARKALEAGNDLLIVSQFATRNEWRLQRANLLDTVAYFAETYRTDPGFASRVDAAALAILQRKAALYPGAWTVEAVRPTPAADGQAPQSDAAAAAARAAVSVLRRPEARSPAPGERVVVITDDAGTLACRTDECVAEGTGDPGAVRPSLVQTYVQTRFAEAGAGAEALSAVTGLTFCQLARALQPAELGEPEPEGDCPAPGRDETLAALRSADWIVFAFTDLNPAAIAHGDAVASFLQVAGGTVKARTTGLAALSFGPPYLFEATDFHKLDVVVAAYSKIAPSVLAAVDALLGGDGPGGAPPVTIEAADYDLPTQLEPDPDRVPQVEVAPKVNGGRTDFAAAVGPVLDRNGHPVPDGTVVEVVAERVDTVQGAGTDDSGLVFPGATTGGRAVIDLVLPAGFAYLLHAESGPALWPELDDALDVPAEPTRAAPVHLSAPDPASIQPARRLRVADLLLALASVVVVSAAWVGVPGWTTRRPEDQLFILLAACAGGLAAYLAYGAMAALGRATPAPAAATAVVGLVGAAIASLAAARRARVKV